MTTNDPYNITFEDAKKSIEDLSGRMAIRLPGHCIIVLDPDIIGEGWIKQFEDTPHGYNQAMRWAVRLSDLDIDSATPVEKLQQEYDRELGFSTE